MQSDTAMRNKNSSPTKQAIVRRSHPAKHGEDRFGPPTLERSGRKFSTVGRLHPRFLREERLGEKGGAFFNGKEGRDDFRKTSFWLKGDGGIRKKLL